MRSFTIPSFIQPSESSDGPSSPMPANGAPLSVLIRAGTPYSRTAASLSARIDEDKENQVAECNKMRLTPADVDRDRLEAILSDKECLVYEHPIAL